LGILDRKRKTERNECDSVQWFYLFIDVGSANVKCANTQFSKENELLLSAFAIQCTHDILSGLVDVWFESALSVL